MLINGYAYGGCTPKQFETAPSGDHSNILPWVHHARDESLFAQDYRIRMGADYATALWPIMGVLARIISTAWLFLAAQIITLVVTYYLIFRLALQCSDDNYDGQTGQTHKPMLCLLTAAVSCLLIITPHFSPAGVAIHDPAFYTRVAALPFVLAGMIFAMRGKATAAALWIAAAVPIHLLTAFYATPLMLACLLWDRRRTLAGIIVAVVIPIAAAVVSPLLIGGSGSMSDAFRVPTESWLQLQRGNNGMHLFPGDWPIAVWSALLATTAMIVPAAWPRHNGLRSPEQIVILSRSLLTGTVLFVALGFVAGHFHPTMLSLQLQPMRALKLVMVLALIPVAWQLVSLGSRSVLSATMAGISVAAICSSRYELAVAAFAILLLVGNKRRPFVTAFCLAAAAILLSIRAGWLGNSGSPMPSGALWIATGVAAVFAGLSAYKPRWSVACCAAAMMAAVIGTAFVHTIKVVGGRVEYMAVAEYPFIASSNDWIVAQRWIRSNTPVNALFLTPADLEGFGSYSQRSHFVDWKQGTVSMFHEKFGEEWSARLQKLVYPRFINEIRARGLNLNAKTLAAIHDAITIGDVQPLIRQYKITHIVTRGEKRLAPYRLIYNNPTYCIYATDQRRE